MSEEETRNKTTERRFFDEIWNKGNFAVANDLIAPDYIDHDSSSPTAGPEGVRKEVSLYRNAFPDLLFAIEDIIAEDDKVVTRLTASGTHQGNLPGIPATGKRATMSGIVITRYENGRAVEAWVKFDFLGLYRQLGAIPPRGGAPADVTKTSPLR
jgi:steroid delta-isomerase-like uncharacterized protein